MSHRLNFIVLLGVEVGITYLPYQAQISKLDEHACGGSIVSTKSIVTAAHCVDDLSGESIIPSHYIVHVGSAKRTTGGVFMSVASIVIHPNWNDGNSAIFQHDITIMKLSNPLVYSLSIQPIALPKANYITEQDSMAFVSGFGHKENDEYSDDLLYTYVPIRNFAECKRSYSIVKMDEETQFCAGMQGKVGFYFIFQ